jgi:hypothetical protein
MEWFVDHIDSDRHHLSQGPELLRAAGITAQTRRGGKERPRAYAVRLNELIIHNNRAWWGEGNIRLDSLIVHGNSSRSNNDFYHPNTFSFPRVRDGEALPIGDPGLLLYFGRPLYFLDLFLLVSRDRTGIDNLAALLSKTLSSKGAAVVLEPFLGLAGAAITADAIALGLQAAADLGNLAYQAVRTVTDATIGLYRTSFLQLADNFGIGTHPKSGYLKAKDLSFKFEVLLG